MLLRQSLKLKVMNSKTHRTSGDRKRVLEVCWRFGLKFTDHHQTTFLIDVTAP